jgi:acyl dehydratase
MVQTLYYEDVEVGLSASSSEYLVREDELITFAQRWDPMPIHVDRVAAAGSVFGGLIASASHTIAIRFLLFRDIEASQFRFETIAGLGATYRLPSPVRPGDQLRLSWGVIATRAAKSRPDAGIVTMRCEMTNRTGDVVFAEPDGSMLVRRRPRTLEPAIGDTEGTDSAGIG